MLIKKLAVVAAGTVLATSAFAQSAREVRGVRIIAIALLVIALVLSSSASVRAQEMEKANADAEFLTKVVPSIAASVKIIEYAQKNASVEKVREFAGRVLKQHKESVKTASEHAKRLKIAVDTNGDKDSKEMIDKLSKLKGSELDVSFLEWLSNIHHDATVFENEVKNGAEPELKTYAKKLSHRRQRTFERGARAPGQVEEVESDKRGHPGSDKGKRGPLRGVGAAGAFRERDPSGVQVVAEIVTEKRGHLPFRSSGHARDLHSAP